MRAKLEVTFITVYNTSGTFTDDEAQFYFEENLCVDNVLEQALRTATEQRTCNCFTAKIKFLGWEPDANNPDPKKV